MHRVLLVEDYPPLLLMYREALSKEHECCAVGSAEEAVEAVAEDDFDVVVTDISLPGMSGFELLKRIWQKCPDLPAIIISGSRPPKRGESSLKRDENVGDRAGYTYLEKPFDVEELVSAVNRAAANNSRRPPGGSSRH